MLTETFSLFNDANLTDEFSGEFNIVHNTDLSDNPQDFVLYLGSLGSGASDLDDRQLQVETNPGVDDILIVVDYILPTWTANTVYALGDCIKPVGVDFRMKCVFAGTSDNLTEPDWDSMGGVGSIILDNTVNWKKVSADHPITEIKLATTNGGLAGATPGASLNLGDTILSGTANVQEVHIRVTNAVTSVGNNSATPELALAINSLVEREV